MNGNSISDQIFLKQLTEITKTNLSNSQFGVSELAREMGMSRSNLHLKVKKAAKISVSQFINHVRLKKAMELLKQESFTVSEAAFECGFNSVTYFTKCFGDYYGYPPSEAGKHDETEEIPVDFKKLNSFKHKRWAVLTILALAILIPVGTFTYNFLSNKILASKTVEPEKTIAVLLFKNDSQDTTNVYFMNGLMESILNNLSQIPELIVRSRTSVERFRNTTKSLLEIAKDLNVNYIVEGSGQKYDDQVVLNIQLLEANTDRHLLSKQYRSEVKDLIGLQNEIALDLVSKIKNKINPEEVRWHNEISAENYDALDFYYQGYELQKSSEGNKNMLKMKIQAKAKFEKALELDSTFTLPMVQLSWIYVTFFHEGIIDNLDTAFYFANKALHYDKESAKIYGLFGYLYQYKGDLDEALKYFQKHLKYGGVHYRNIGVLYFKMGEYLNGIEYTFKQLQFMLEDYQKVDYWTLIALQHQLRMLVFFEESNKYSALILKQNNDSAAYFERLMFIHFTFGNFDSVVYIGEQRSKIDSTNLSWTLPVAHLNLKNSNEAYKWFKFYDYGKKILEPDDQDEIEGLAYILLQNGQTEKADLVFSEAIKSINQPHKTIYSELHVPNIRLASVYSAMNEKEKAMDYLRANKSRHLLALTILKSSPLFDNIRNEPEFQKIVKDVEIKFQKHHKQVAEFLRKKGEIK